MTALNSSLPLRVESDVLSGRGLEPIGPWPEGMRLMGAEPALLKTWFEGQIAIQICEIPDGVLRYPRTSFDELVVVLHGSATITPEGSEPQTFNEGEMFVLPQGFQGQFAVQGRYRELTVMETAAMKALAEAWNLSL